MTAVVKTAVVRLLRSSGPINPMITILTNGVEHLQVLRLKNVFSKYLTQSMQQQQGILAWKETNGKMLR